FAAARVGLGGVAVEAGLAQQVGTCPLDHPQRAVFQPSAHGGDAEAHGVAALADGEAGAVEFVDVGGAGGVGVPSDVTGNLPDMVGQGPFVFVVLAGQPQNIVAIQHAPDRGERVAESPVHAADLPP